MQLDLAIQYGLDYIYSRNGSAEGQSDFRCPSDLKVYNGQDENSFIIAVGGLFRFELTVNQTDQTMEVKKQFQIPPDNFTVLWDGSCKKNFDEVIIELNRKTSCTWFRYKILCIGCTKTDQIYSLIDPRYMTVTLNWTSYTLRELARKVWKDGHRIDGTHPVCNADDEPYYCQWPIWAKKASWDKEIGEFVDAVSKLSVTDVVSMCREKVSAVEQRDPSKLSLEAVDYLGSAWRVVFGIEDLHYIVCRVTESQDIAWSEPGTIGQAVEHPLYVGTIEEQMR